MMVHVTNNKATYWNLEYKTDLQDLRTREKQSYVTAK